MTCCFEDYESISIAYVSEGGQDDALKMAMEEVYGQWNTIICGELYK